MKHLIFILVLFCFSNIAEAQVFCKTPSVTNTKNVETLQMEQKSASDASYSLKVYFHVIRQSSGTGGVSTSNVQDAFNMLNNDYNSHNIYFIWNGTIDYINNSSYYNNPDTYIFNVNNHTDGIDIYIFPSILCNFGGLANGIGVSSELLIIGTLCTTHVISHEMGHVLNLWHTHHGTLNSSGENGNDPNHCQEYANGSNSSSCGDYVEDTPADPCLSDIVNQSTCQLNGTYYDPLGVAYSPDIQQIMSYAPVTCMTHFSYMQGIRMRNAIAALTHLKNAQVKIVGPSIICNNAIYYLDFLPSGHSVTWSFKAGGSNNLILQNSPSTNQCTITLGNTNFTGTLVATIWKNGNVVAKVEKDIMTPQSLTGTIHQEGQYYYGRNYPSFTIGMESIFAVNQVCQITLQSPKFKHMNFSTTTNPAASVSLQRIDDETIQFHVSLSTTDVDLRIYGTGNGSCNDFELRVLAMKNPIDPNNPFYINMSGSTIELELNQAMMRNLNGSDTDADDMTQQPWALDVYEAITGRKVYTEQVVGNSLNIDTSGWNAGIYILYAVINGKTYSTKVTVK